MQRVKSLIEAVAPMDLTVLITGESGVGKEVIAQQIFSRSLRSDGPFIKINTAAIPDGLLESELFGYQEGAFTGAEKRRIGRIEAAHRGTLFFDEIAELNQRSQSKLLHIMQDRRFMPLGSNHPIGVDIRILAATNRDLAEDVENGRFREDLYYRLNVIHIQVPPLRDRPDDIRALTRYFLDKYTGQYGKNQFIELDERHQELLLRYRWPGNVRELKNFVKNIVLFQDIHSSFAGLQNRICRIEKREREEPSLVAMAARAEARVEKKVIESVLQRTGWNRKRTAEILNISYRSLLNKIKKLEIESSAKEEKS